VLQSILTSVEPGSEWFGQSGEGVVVLGEEHVLVNVVSHAAQFTNIVAITDAHGEEHRPLLAAGVGGIDGHGGAAAGASTDPHGIVWDTRSAPVGGSERIGVHPVDGTTGVWFTGFVLDAVDGVVQLLYGVVLVQVELVVHTGTVGDNADMRALGVQVVVANVVLYKLQLLQKVICSNIV